MKVYQFVVVYRPGKDQSQKPSIVDDGVVLAKDEQAACLEVGRKHEVSQYSTENLEVLLRPF